MKAIRFILAGALLAWLSVPLASHAEDTDIYSSAANGSVPNVLLVMDTAANFSSNAAVPCTAYSTAAGGGAPSLGGTVGGVEQCALVDTIAGLPDDGTVNIGMMVYNANNFTNGAASYVETCVGSDGGCLVQKLKLMDSAGKAALIKFIKSWTSSGSNSSSQFVVKTNNEHTGAAMQEAWAYYLGKTGMSGKVYSPAVVGGGCQRNFIIFVGNSFSNSGGPGDPNADPNNSTTGLASTQVAATVAQKLKLSNTVYFPATTCGVDHLAASTNASDWSENWADEWARYMKGTDFSSALDGDQNIITYTIGVINNSPNTCKPEYPALLKNMAYYGGGKYFQTGDASSVKTALFTILNEVQAVNSVFSSSSLPVSVNTQGTYLNQIYMGMFRPDASASPRWLGNLKQYQFIIDSNGILRLGDSLGKDAISSAGTGFISPNAVSYWSKKDLAVAPDLDGGFWRNQPSGVGLAYDSPDGELVEKGGAAQQLRLKNLTNDYTANPTSPRKLYTYCPGGSNCVAQLSDSANAFATSNTALTASLLGAVSGVSVSSITRSGTTATVTTSSAHGFANGASVTISGATQPEYDGTFSITYISTTQFKYTVVENPPATATGSFTVTVPGSPQLITSITRSGTTATVTLNGHGFASGQSITITGATQAEYNGTFTITKIDNDSFSYSVVEGPTSPAGGGTATVGATVRTIEAYTANPNPGVVRTAGSTTVTVTTTVNHGFSTGNLVTIANVKDSSGNVITAYNATSVALTKISNKSFTYTISATTPSTPATGSAYADGSTVAKTITSLTRSGTTATATVAAHGFINGQTVSIGGTPGTGEFAYIGSYVISNKTTNTFDYTVTLSPTSPATGTITANVGGTSDRTSLINWVRGEDNVGDEASPTNAAGAHAYTVRPSIHADVLHSRPVVLNYGTGTGVVAFYGTNDGVFHAVNGNQTADIGTVKAGGEMWGLVLPEFLGKLNRQRTASPALLLPTTLDGIVPTPAKKDYFVDGATGVYQKLNADGSTSAANLYLTMRRGGRFIYALNVKNPADPKVLWKISNTSTGFSELGQTWSRPRLALTNVAAHPTVLIFGGGYDATAEDAEPPTADTMGRSIFVVDAFTGELVWSAGNSANNPTLSVTGMDYAIPSDIAMLDRDFDGKTDRLYATDVGGNVWRVDMGDALTSNWKVTKLAALGCDAGVCASGTTPRKFFYPPSVVPLGATGAPTAYDAVLIGTGDREHPLATDSAYNVTNRFYVLKDLKTGMDATGQATITQTGSPLFHVTATIPYVDSLTSRGFYIEFATGEKEVNAPLTLAGITYFGTNQPSTSLTTCADLGIARGYSVSLFTGAFTSTILEGGGLPPSPVAGITTVNGKQASFCIGCVTTNIPVCDANGQNCTTPPPCNSAIQNCVPPQDGAKKLNRTYWYKK